VAVTGKMWFRMPRQPQGAAPTVRACLPAAPASIAQARYLVGALCRQIGSEEQAADVVLAVSEAVTNAVCHGYRDGQTGDIDLWAAVEGDELVAVIRDYGVGPLAHPEAPGAGLGLQIMAHVASHCRIAPARPGTAATLRFNLGREK
jgi:anti-sigma regulatory factor (Ser/Thr protein kinase)